MKARDNYDIRQKNKLKLGITPKLLVSILAPLFIVLTIMGVFLGVQSSNTVNKIISSELDAETKAAAKEVDGFFKRYYGVSETLASTQLVRDVLVEKTEGGISKHRLYNSLLQTLDFVQQDNEEDVNYVWVFSLTTEEILQNNGQIYEKEDVDFSSRSWYKMVMDKQDTIITETYVSANSDSNTVTVASPVFINGNIMGVIGMDINMQHLNEVLSAITVGKNGYITLYDSNSQIIYHPDSSVINTNAADAEYSSNILDPLLSKTDQSSTLYTRRGTSYYGSILNIDDSGYTVLGIMPQEEFVSHTSTMIWILVTGVSSCAILLAIICILIALSITKPLKRLNHAVDKLASGELDVEVQVNSHDEVGDVARGVEKIVERLKVYILYIDEISNVLRQIGKGDLTFTLQHEYSGDFAKVKKSLLSIRSTLTETMVSISQSADQVNAGAEQISSGAQSLAQGATEQASSVQELSSAIQDLSGQATSEAAKAVEAVKFLEQIKDEVEKSNNQMEMMREAMEDISTQSTAIRSIIKTIDDIAFQTNILALNAAVEAARAGTAGKGFSVVADEVRNLAGKSAEAAKKTNQLIENSVRAVQHGGELTQKTADSLSTVADGSRKAVDTLNKITIAYHEQADRLSEIAKGVDQIADVVQTNSATAEESAAASEELSGQANMMRDQVAHFKLDEALTSSGAQDDVLIHNSAANYYEVDKEGKY